MKVLSLFDGISCGRLALERAEIKVTSYYASEIDKYAMQVSKKNWPDIVQVGDVCDLFVDNQRYSSCTGSWQLTDVPQPWFNCLIGGSPCQSLSNSGNGSGFDGKSKLFWEYARILRLLRMINPGIKFLLENVKMKKEWRDIITKELGVEPILINSKLVSAQNRERYYWTNIEGVTQPEDKGILVRDILEFEVDEKWLHSKKAEDYMGRVAPDGRTKWDFMYHSDSDKPKSACVTANFLKGVPNNVLLTEEAISRIKRKKYSQPKIFPDKTGALNTKNNSGQLSVDSGTTLIPVGKYLRRFTPLEVERLQTLPDNYTESISSTQRYKAIGNGWTVDVIAHIFKNLKS